MRAFRCDKTAVACVGGGCGFMVMTGRSTIIHFVTWLAQHFPSPDEYEYIVTSTQRPWKKHRQVKANTICPGYLPSDPNYTGLFLVISADAAAPLWGVSHTPGDQIAHLHHRK